MLSIRGTDFTACWAYEERISAHAQPAVKCEQFYMYNLCWAYAERILSHTEHTRNQFHRILSIRGTDFIACWACAEMFKSRISRTNRIRFSRISCYKLCILCMVPIMLGFSSAKMCTVCRCPMHMVPTVLDRREEFIAGNLANTHFPLKVEPPCRTWLKCFKYLNF